MKIRLKHLLVYTRQSIERIEFSEAVTFLHGPVGTGKSTVVRLVDYCLGGELEETPAIQKEFVAATLSLKIGEYDCTLERAIHDKQSVRVTWSRSEDDFGSVNAPLSAGDCPLLDPEVYNFSDLMFHLAGVSPIKVRRRRWDPDSPLVRLSFRDVWRYCYLDQTHLDSSFFRLEDPFRGRKSQDAMRFFTGLHSERLSQLETELMRTIDIQETKREAVQQIRDFMSRFDLGTGLDSQLHLAKRELAEAQQRQRELEEKRSADIHPTDYLREELRKLSLEIENVRQAVVDSQEMITQQKALRAELITAKVKAERANQAGRILQGVQYQYCPQCGVDLTHRVEHGEHCSLCGSTHSDNSNTNPLQLEALRRDLNERIDQVTYSVARRERKLRRTRIYLEQLNQHKRSLDKRLQEELSRYDSAFLESIRTVERKIATLVERIRSLEHLKQMPQAINDLEEEAGSLQGRIDNLRTLVIEERQRLVHADENIQAIAYEFKRILLAVSFPGVTKDDDVAIDPRNWKPVVFHDEQEWTFWDTGSGGKKTLFNVCYALALHTVAINRRLPVPTVLIIDSPTKNISEDVNPELVCSLYAEIYRIARDQNGAGIQFLIIDSELVEPNTDVRGFKARRMAGEPGSPSLIPYYVGP